MKRPAYYTFLLSVCVLMVSCNFNSSKEKTSQPNIIYILADDLGYGDIRSLNPESKIPTPNIDAIVKDGVYFTDTHSNSAVCTPTRYGILTGEYAFRTRLKRGVLYGYDSSLIDENKLTVADYLKSKGYNTACIGKWHLGLDWPAIDKLKSIGIQLNEASPASEDNVNYSEYISGGPSDHGFDYSMIIPASLDIPPYCYVRNGYVVDEPLDYTDGRIQEEDGRGVFWRPGKMPKGFDFEQVLPNVIDTATNYIAKTETKSPFFMYLSLPSPHTPWLPSNKYNGKSGAGRYGDYVHMVDDMVGKVMSMVRKKGIEENTLIILTSDNGSDWRPSDIEKWDHKSNYIFKGRKADIYEAGHRIPFIAQWKGVIPKGHKSSEIMCTTDLFGTIAGLLDTEIPNNEGEDSYNLWPAFIGSPKQPIRESIIHHSFDGSYSIRKGKWKFTPKLGSRGFTDPKELVPQEGQPPSTLYDIQADPEEQNNLYYQNPEIVKELSALLEYDKIKGYRRPMMNGFNKGDLDFREFLAPVPKSGKFINDSLYIWGGSLVKSVDGKYHMFYSQWPRELGMKSWVTHSLIAHAVSDGPFGPFKFNDIALGERDNKYWDGLVAHNPTIHYFNGKYYLYYMGTTGKYNDRKYWDFRNKQKIGVAISESPYGPWERFEEPLINTSSDPDAHDAIMVSNPSVTQIPDGQYLMVYKAVAKKGKAPKYGPVVNLTAISKSPQGPFIKQNNPVFTAEDNEFPAEDPFVWFDKQSNQYLALVKDMNGAFTNAGVSLVLFTSKNGLDWKLAKNPLVSKLEITWEDGRIQQLDKLERPQLYFENGKPFALLCAARISEDHSFNVQIPIK
jgi:arylsulfatase A-like enzyme/predicted GH43/DUF377 family glycosyl hydrolase